MTSETIEDYIERYLFWRNSAKGFVTPEGNLALDKCEKILQGAVLKFRIKRTEFEHKVNVFEREQKLAKMESETHDFSERVD